MSSRFRSIHFAKKWMRKKRRKRDLLIQFNGRSQDWEEEGPGSNLGTLNPSTCPKRLSRSLLSFRSSFLISPGTKKSDCEWPLGWRSFEEGAEQWPLCQPRGLQGTGSWQRGEGTEPHFLQLQELKWSPGGKTAFPSCLEVCYSICPQHLGQLMSFQISLPSCPRHPLPP